jgi:hypothetical protein
MDAAILAARNRWRALASRPHARRLSALSGGLRVGLAPSRGCADVRVDGGAAESQRVHNLLVLNTALYAGEFRFDGTDQRRQPPPTCMRSPTPVPTCAASVTAWRRHLGTAVAPAPLRRVTALSATFAAPFAATRPAKGRRWARSSSRSHRRSACRHAAG